MAATLSRGGLAIVLKQHQLRNRIFPYANPISLLSVIFIASGVARSVDLALTGAKDLSLARRSSNRKRVDRDARRPDSVRDKLAPIMIL